MHWGTGKTKPRRESDRTSDRKGTTGLFFSSVNGGRVKKRDALVSEHQRAPNRRSAFDGCDS